MLRPSPGVPMRASRLAVLASLSFVLPAGAAALAGIGLAGCGPSAAAGAMPRYPKESTIKGVGQRCAGGLCACRPLVGGDQEEQSPPAPGKKRFELRIPVTVHPVWVNVPGVGTFFKGSDRGEETCAYVDLAPGEHQVTYMIQERNRQEGFAALFRIFEYGRKTRSWYQVFTVDCGVADSTCTKPEIQEWGKQIIAKKGILDTCSSTRFKNVKWTSNEWEGARLQELAVTVTLKVYKFEPTRAPRSECHGRGPAEPAAAPPAAEPPTP
jgi:hypothetical protein